VATPTATVPSLLPAPSPTPVFDRAALRRVETDTRFVNALALADGAVWLATEGGALAWRAGATTPEKYTSLDGLPGNRLTAVVACPLPGLGIVFGSDAGLAIFDPASGAWRQMNPDNSGMRFTDVSALVCDAAGMRLLIGYAVHGIDIFDVASNEWERLDRSSGLGANDVRALALDNEGDAIWAVSSQGVTRAAGQDSAFFDMGSPPLDTLQVAAITVAPSGLVWLGGDGTLYRINGETWTRFAGDTTDDGQFPNELITGLAVAADGSVWLVDTAATACRFSAIQNRCVEFYRGAPSMADGPVTDLALDGEQPIYTTGNGYTLLDEGRRRTLVEEEHLAGNDVRSLAVDNDGILWVTTNARVQRFTDAGGAGGLLPFAPADLASPGVGLLHPGPDGGMWLSGQGVSFYDGDTWTTYRVRDGLVSETVQAIATDSQGRTWFGTDGGLSIWNGDTFVNITAAQGLPSADIRALAAADNAMWIGSWGGGLYRFADNQLEVFNVENTGLPSDQISAVAVLPDGDLLLGTEQGLARFADGAVTPMDAIAAPVTAIELIDGVAWVATPGDGLFVQQGSGWTPVAPADGLPAATITAIAATPDTIWLGGATGGLVGIDRN
jgi:ligand-binding sensor domain-containing protein